MNDHEHDRFLHTQNGTMHFGCVNPFCGHGSPTLPKGWDIPMETDAVVIKVLSHKDRFLKFELTLKKRVGKHKVGDIVTLECADNLSACKNAFAKFFKRGGE